MSAALDSLDDEVEEKHPPDLPLGEHVFEVAFHPSEHLIAAGLISGRVEIIRYSVEGNLHVASLNHHKKSCRALQFSADGQVLFTGSKDKALQVINTETQTSVYRLPKAHSNPINTLVRLGNQQLASADDAGVTKIWDLRQQRSIREYSDQEDYVADLLFVPEKSTLLAASGDGTLAVYDVRYHKAAARSDQLEDELLSIGLVKGGRKVVCGSQDGVLDIYKWGEWADISDRFPGHPSSIDGMVVINDDLIVTGSSDGLIRVVSIHPNKFMGVVGEHADFPIERIRLSPDNRYLASCSHDETIKFWNIEYLFDAASDEDDDDEDGGGGSSEDDDDDCDSWSSDGEGAGAGRMDTDDRPARPKQAARGRPKGKQKASFFSGLEE